MRVIKAHNLFAVNDLYFARQMVVRLEIMNNYGSSLILAIGKNPPELA